MVAAVLCEESIDLCILIYGFLCVFVFFWDPFESWALRGGRVKKRNSGLKKKKSPRVKKRKLEVEDSMEVGKRSEAGEGE